MPRPGDRGAAWQRCRAVLSAAIDITCAALLIAVPSDPDLLLGAAYVCMKLRRPRQAYEAVARLSATVVGQLAQPDRTARQMTKIAAAICAWGQRVEAKDVLRAAIVAEPHLAAPRLARADCLIASRRYVEAEAVAVAAVQCCPSSPELRLALARIQFQLRRFEDAARTIEALLAITPGHAWAWFEYGKILRNSFHRLSQADRAFGRAGDLAGND